MKPRSILPLAITVSSLFFAAACGHPNSHTPPAQIGQSDQNSNGNLQPIDTQRVLQVNGQERSYLIHIPSSLKNSSKAALVFVFHGLQETATFIQQNSGFNDVSDQGGFIVVYPNGSGPSGGFSWNVGGCCGYAGDNNVDETAFIRQIIKDVSNLSKIDTNRIYATGFSNGGLLSYHLACGLSETFAAVAPVAGVLLDTTCSPAHPISVIDFHGLSDNVVPIYGGGLIPGSSQPFPSDEKSIQTWAQLDKCAGNPLVEQTNIFIHTTYSGCMNGTAVELYAIKGIGHSWPSKYVVPASQIIWDFFNAHSKQ